MKPFRLVESVATPDGRELTLHRRDDDFHIDLDGLNLMSSRAHGSEEEMVRMAFEALGDRTPRRILIGGLGMGYTLRATLDALDEENPDGAPAEVVVAEAFTPVAAWNRGPLAHLAGRPLDDPRVRVVIGDVADRIEEAANGGGAWDLLLLDVDNGPEAFTLDQNQQLYTDAGLRRIARALAPSGALAVWSAHDDPAFTRRLGKAGFEARARRLRARSCGKGPRHVICVGSLRSSARAPRR